MSSLQEAKLWAVHYFGLSRDALHVYIALILFLGSAALFRWRLSGWRPWLIVLVVALVGEIWDIHDDLARDEPVRLRASWHDIWNTLFWPTVLMALARWTKLLRS